MLSLVNYQIVKHTFK